MKRAFADFVARAAHSRVGKRALTRFFADIGPITNPRTGLGTAALPHSLDGFEDLVFLLSSNLLNHGVAALRTDEAAYLYKLVRDLARRRSSRSVASWEAAPC